MKKKEEERSLTSSTSGKKHSGDGILRSTLLVAAELMPLWLDVVPPVRQGRGIVGRSTPLLYHLVALFLRTRRRRCRRRRVDLVRQTRKVAREEGGLPFRFARGNKPRGGRRGSYPGSFHRVWRGLDGVVTPAGFNRTRFESRQGLKPGLRETTWIDGIGIQSRGGRG
jgi:hypothetical protein